MFNMILRNDIKDDPGALPLDWQKPKMPEYGKRQNYDDIKHDLKLLDGQTKISYRKENGK